MTEQRIAYALICLVGTYLFSCLHELCWLETQSFEIAVLRNGHLKIAKLGIMVRGCLDKALRWNALDSGHQILQRGGRKTVDN